PHRDAVRTRLALRLGTRGPPTRRDGLTRDDNGAATFCSVLVIPRGAGSGGLHLLSFVLPAGLADGLALKELRYALRRFAPGLAADLVPPRPEGSGFGLMVGGHRNSATGGSAL